MRFHTAEEGAALAAELEGVRSRMLAAVATLCGMGLVAIYSASGVRAAGGGWEMGYLASQAMWLAIGCVGLGAVSLCNYRALARLWPLALVACAGLLAAVRVPGVGTNVRGAYRWFRVAGVSVQPSELAKLGLVLVVAAMLARAEGGRLKFWRHFLPVACVIGLAAGLIVIEPDFGTAALVAAGLTALLVAGGARWWQIGALCAACVPPVAYYGLTKFDHIIARVEAWRSGATDGAGWQTWMSKVAFGSGGLTGMGLGKGHATLYYLPDAHTDFVMAVAGQELGLIGSLFIVAMFAIFVNEGLKLVRLAPDRLGALLAFGIVTMIGLQAAFNIAVVTAVVPPKGISLPFVSFGGSGVCVALAEVGVLCAVARRGIKEALAAGTERADAEFLTWRERVERERAAREETVAAEPAEELEAAA